MNGIHTGLVLSGDGMRRVAHVGPINIRIVKSDEEKFVYFDVVITPRKVTHCGLFDKKNMDVIYKIGYDHMHRALLNNTKNINKQRLSTLQL